MNISDHYIIHPTHFKRHFGADWISWPHGHIELNLFLNMRDPDFVKVKTTVGHIVRFHAVYTVGEPYEWNSIEGIVECKDPVSDVGKSSEDRYYTVTCSHCNQTYFTVLKDVTKSTCPSCNKLNNAAPALTYRCLWCGTTLTDNDLRCPGCKNPNMHWGSNRC